MQNQQTVVLLIEDNPADARLVRELLADAKGDDFTLIAADTLMAGLKRLTKGGIDLILLDLGLSDSQGIETFGRVRAQGPDVPIVVLTGLDDEAVALQAVREGAQDYLVKGALDGTLLVRSVRHSVQRHGLQRALWASERQLRRIIEVNRDAILVVDNAGIVRFANPAAEALFGRSAEHLLGEEFGFAVTLEGVTQIDVFRSPGERLKVDARATHLDWEGQRAYLVSLADVTQHERAEEALRQSEMRYRRLMESFPAITYSAALDRVSGILYISSQVETILGFRPAEFLGDSRLWQDQLHADDRDRVLSEIDRYATQEPFVTEYRMHRRDGDVVWFRDQIVSARNESGLTRYLQGVMYDVTRYKDPVTPAVG